MGNCLFIPSEGKIEYRNPGLLSRVEFTEALGASFTHLIPPAFSPAEIFFKKCYSRNPADSCITHSLRRMTQEHTHKHMHYPT